MQIIELRSFQLKNSKFELQRTVKLPKCEVRTAMEFDAFPVQKSSPSKFELGIFKA
jgi:hypothetical protein